MAAAPVVDIEKQTVLESQAVRVAAAEIVDFDPAEQEPQVKVILEGVQKEAVLTGQPAAAVGQEPRDKAYLVAMPEAETAEPA